MKIKPKKVKWDDGKASVTNDKLLKQMTMAVDEWQVGNYSLC